MARSKKELKQLKATYEAAQAEIEKTALSSMPTDPWRDLNLPPMEKPDKYTSKGLLIRGNGLGMPRNPVHNNVGRFISSSSKKTPGTKVLTNILKDKLKELDSKTLISKAELIIDKLIELALNGYFPAIQEVLDRIDGKITDTHKIEGELPVTLIFKPAEELKALPTITIEGETRELAEGEEQLYEST